MFKLSFLGYVKTTRESIVNSAGKTLKNLSEMGENDMFIMGENDVYNFGNHKENPDELYL